MGATAAESRILLATPSSLQPQTDLMFSSGRASWFPSLLPGISRLRPGCSTEAISHTLTCFLCRNQSNPHSPCSPQESSAPP